jgi:sporulation protein YabP
MPMIESHKEVAHDVRMTNRRMIEVTGVQSVDRFDRELFVLKTPRGMLHIQGESLRIKNLVLEQGFLAVEGEVHSIAYVESKTGTKSTRDRSLKQTVSRWFT